MFKKFNLKIRLIFYFNLTLIILMTILSIFVGKGIDPRKDPDVIKKYLFENDRFITPITLELNSIWRMGNILQNVYGTRFLIETYFKKGSSGNMKDLLKEPMASLNNMLRYEDPGFNTLMVFFRDGKIPFKIDFDHKQKMIHLELDPTISPEVSDFLLNLAKDIAKNKNFYIRFKIFPSNYKLFYIFTPLIDENNNFAGIGMLSFTLSQQIQELFFPKKSNEEESFFLFNPQMKLAQVSGSGPFFGDYFPELPKNFLSDKKSSFWDKDGNLFVKSEIRLKFKNFETNYLLQRIPKHLIGAHLIPFKRHLITLIIFLLVITSIFAFFAISKELGPLKGVIQELNGATKVIKTSSKLLNDTSTNWAESSMETSAGVETVIFSTEGFLQTFGEIKDETEKADLISKRGSELANSIRIETEKLLDSIKEISTTSKKIEEINKIIGDISFQTNLLALNASVEAARAGEHGRGFAIVAESIRELADKTAQSTDAISKLILEAWTKSQKGSRAASNSNEIIGAVVSNIKQMRSVVENINNSIHGQYEKIQPMKNGLSLLENTVKSGASNAIKGSEIGQSLNNQTVKLTEIVIDLSKTIVGKID